MLGMTPVRICLNELAIKDSIYLSVHDENVTPSARLMLTILIFKLIFATLSSGRGANPHRRYFYQLMINEPVSAFFNRKGQQIWCESKADGYSPDERRYAPKRCHPEHIVEGFSFVFYHLFTNVYYALKYE